VSRLPKRYLLALFLPELALLAFGVTLLLTSHRWLGVAIIAVLAGAQVFALVVVFAAKRDYAKGRLKPPFKR
jgi:energy-converting hydrogenase Eha subunit C